MRVLHVASSLNRVSGVANVILNYYRQLKDKVIFDFLLFDKYEDSFCDEVKNYGSKVYFIPKFGILSYGQYKKKIKTFFDMHAKEYDVIHLHELMNQRVIILFAHKYGLKVIVHSHGQYPGIKLVGLKKGLRNKFLLRGFDKHADRYLACSEHAARALKHAKHISILKNGIDVSRYTDSEDLRKEFNINDNTFVIGSAGRITYVKNPLAVVEIFNLYHDMNADSVLLVVGSGDMLEDMKRKVKQCGIENDVIFAGNRSDMARVLKTFDCFVMPSYNFEGLPVVLVEAQACGLPCFVSDNVPKEANIINNMIFLSINESSYKNWVDRINHSGRKGKEECLAKFRENGYDLSLSADNLLDIYKECSGVF